MYSGITRGRVLNEELYAQKISEVNLSAFIWRLFHEDIPSIGRTNTAFVPIIDGKSSWNSV